MEEKVESRGLYYVMPAHIMDSEQINPLEKLCYILLSGLANKNGTCFPSDAYLAKRLNTSIDTIKRIMRKLDSVGLISRKQSHQKNNPFKKQRIITVHNDFKKSLRSGADDTSERCIYDTSGGGTGAPIVSEVNIVSEVSRNTSEISQESRTSTHEKNLCDYFLERRKKLFPKMKDPNMKRWMKDIRQMHKIDDRTWEEIKETIDYVFDHEFWCKNILSMDKLRKHFDKLYAERQPVENAGSNKKINKQTALSLLDFLLKRGEKNTIRLLEDGVYVIDKKETILYSLPINTFDEIICKYLGVTKK